MKLLRKRVVVPAVISVVALAGAGVAYGFFTAGGTGTGSAQVGTTTNFVIAQTGGPSGNLYPDASVGSGPNFVTIPYSVTNAGKGDEQLGSVTVSIATTNGSTWSSQTDSSEPACTASDFSIGAGTPGTPFVDSSLSGTFTGGQTVDFALSLEMIDNGLNQDNCQGQSVPLYFVASSAAPAANPNLSIEPADGSGGWGPNLTYAIVPTVTVDESVSLTVTVEQPNSELSDGTITVTYDPTYLTFTGTSPDALNCTAPSPTQESCSYTDLDNSYSSKPFYFTTQKAGETIATAEVSVTGQGTVTQSFPLLIG